MEAVEVALRSPHETPRALHRMWERKECLRGIHGVLPRHCIVYGSEKTDYPSIWIAELYLRHCLA